MFCLLCYIQPVLWYGRTAFHTESSIKVHMLYGFGLKAKLSGLALAFSLGLVFLSLAFGLGLNLLHILCQ